MAIKTINQTAVLLVTLCLLVCKCSGSDPCLYADTFTTGYIGGRNEFCDQPATGSPYCDGFITAGWYKVADGVMLTQCPSAACSVTYPVWLNVSALPQVGDDIVNGTACVKIAGECCKDGWPLQVKNCSGFYIYHLQSVQHSVCDSAYCFESPFQCTPPTTRTTTLTTTATNGAVPTHDTGDDNDGDKHERPSALLITLIVVVGAMLIALTVVILILVKNYRRPLAPKNVVEAGDVQKECRPRSPPPKYNSWTVDKPIKR